MQPRFLKQLQGIPPKKYGSGVNTLLDKQRVLFYVSTIPKTGTMSFATGLQNWVNQRLQTRYPNFTHVVHCHSFGSWTRHFGQQLQGSLRDMFQMFPKEGMLGIQRPIVFQLFRHPWDQIVSSFFHHHLHDPSFPKELTMDHFYTFLKEKRLHIQYLWKEYEDQFGFSKEQCQEILVDPSSPFRVHFISTSDCDVLFLPTELLKGDTVRRIMSQCFPQIDWNQLLIPEINKYQPSPKRDAFRHHLLSLSTERHALYLIHHELCSFFYRIETMPLMKKDFQKKDKNKKKN